MAGSAATDSAERIEPRERRGDKARERAYSLYRLDHTRDTETDRQHRRADAIRERGARAMLRSEAKEQIIRNPARYLKLDNQSQHCHSVRHGYICPICGSGTGKKGTGITTKDGVHFTCWAGCFTNSDIIDIIGLEYGLTNYNDKLERACTEYGIDYSQLQSDYSLADASERARLARARADFRDLEKPAQNPPKNGQSTDNTHNTSSAPNTANTDYVEFYKECARHRGESDYLAKRGISEGVQASFLIGFCSAWRSPTALKRGANPPATPRVIIPTSRYSYIARDTRPAEGMSDKERQFSKMKEGSLALFNLRAFEDMKEPAFIVEGEIDALSIVEIGHRAIALGSTTNYKKLLDYVKENRPAQPLLIALDADKSGIETTKKLLAGLRELNIESYGVNINGIYKDANERLTSDRDGLKQAVEDAIEAGKTAREAEKQAYLETSTAHYLEDFINGIAESVNTPYTPTGFKELDNNLDGGLYEGLYIVGAISSLGKTTLALQIADQVAKQGRDVLIFSLEMARTELMAKSISRLTAELAIENKRPITNAKTTRGITVYGFYKAYSQDELGLIDNAINAYGDYADHVYISEGIGDIGVEGIRETIKKHISITGNTPVVVVDYLQIIAPYNDRATDKQNTDKAVLELKRISRDFKLPIIGISSFNRDNYNAGVSMQAFKESGAIEYGSDVLIGLQLEGAGESGFDVDRAKSENPRKIEAKILKNRNGKTGATVRLEYYPQYNYFVNAIGVAGATRQQDKKPKLSKRERQRQELCLAIEQSKDRDGKALLVDVADKLDISTRQVQSRMKELGIKLAIDKGYITEWKEIDESEENPFTIDESESEENPFTV